MTTVIMSLWATKRQSQSYYLIHHDHNSLFKVLSLCYERSVLDFTAIVLGQNAPLFIATIVVLPSIATIELFVMFEI